MKKGDNVHLYQCQSIRAPGFITDIKQRKQRYIYIYICVCVCVGACVHVFPYFRQYERN